MHGLPIEKKRSSSCCRSCAKRKSRAASNISGGVGVLPLPPRERRAPPPPGGGGDPSCCCSSGTKTLMRGMTRYTFQRTPKSSKPEIGNHGRVVPVCDLGEERSAGRRFPPGVICTWSAPWLHFLLP